LHNELLSRLEDLGVDTTRVLDNGEVCSKCPNPSHEDSHPSFYFNLYSQKYQCFGGCIKGRGIDQLTFQLTGKKPSTPCVFSILPEIKKRQIIPAIPVLPTAINNDGEEYLKSRKFTREIIEKFGLLYWREKMAVVIPLNDVGYILRFIVPTDKKYKYVSGTKISSTLFGLNKFETKDKSAILVEGAFDVIHLHQLGFTNSLAILHSDLSSDQIKILKGLVLKIYICLDNDFGGNTVTQKIVPILKKNFIIKVCTLPQNKDPNDCEFIDIKNAILNSK
jgi:DNA primase